MQRILPLIAVCALVLSACGSLPNPQPTPQSVFPSPVAFVTAETIPESPPTATLPVLPTNTPAPATAVPKREPQNSTAAIGLWASNIPQDPLYPGYLDIAGGPGTVEYRSQTNQLLVALDLQQVSTGFATTISDVIRTNANYVLYDKAKKVARDANGDPLLDIRTEAIRKLIADGIAQRISSVDGIIISEAGDGLIRAKDTPVFTGTTAFTAEQRRSAVEALLRAIRARIPDKVLIVGGYAWRDGTAYAALKTEALDIGAIVDGVHVTEYVRTPISRTNEFKTEAAWKRDVDMLTELSKDNRIVLLTTRIDGADAGDDLTRQWLTYSVASYLLGKNGARTYFEFATGSAASASDSALSAPVGAPIGDYVKLDSGIYSRKFERGLVLVNPSADSKKTALEPGYRTLSGTAVDVSVTLSPRTGLILVRTTP